MRKSDELLGRFWGKVNIGSPGDCWQWAACKEKDGYGHFGRDGKMRRAHRLSWQFTYGDIPEGMCVLHRCDNPGCVNPSHLFLGTHADNMHDAAQKGRLAHGEENGRHKLTGEDVLEIRELLAKGALTQQNIADEFGVSQAHVSYIKHGKTWCWL